MIRDKSDIEYIVKVKVKKKENIKKLATKYQKSSFIRFFVIALFLAFSAQSCIEVPEPTSLPPETQTGENTFGCYVNDELFVAEPGSAGWYSSHLEAILYNDTSLSISAYGRNNRCVFFTVLNPKENVKQEVDWAYYANKKFHYIGKNIGGVVILTKFDASNLIVSGVFVFDIPFGNIIYAVDKDEPVNDSIARVTQGRFDIKMTLVNR